MSQIRDMRRLAPEVQGVFGEWLRRCNQRGVQVLIYETLRTQERQDKLYALGRTEPGRIVTNAKRSNHQDGRAVDAVPWEAYLAQREIETRLDWKPFESRTIERMFRESKDRSLLDRHWRVMADTAAELGIDWAGDWDGFIEYVHFEKLPQ